LIWVDFAWVDPTETPFNCTARSPLTTTRTNPHQRCPINQCNEVGFSVAGFGKFKGRLAIDATYSPAPPPHDAARVEIRFLEATLRPEALEQLFRANYALLLSIFNPEGWLDVTYLDAEVRVGRDDKGNVFVLERC